MMKSFRPLFSLDSAGTFTHVGARLPQFNAGNPSSHPSDCSPIKAGDGRTRWTAGQPTSSNGVAPISKKPLNPDFPISLPGNRFFPDHTLEVKCNPVTGGNNRVMGQVWSAEYPGNGCIVPASNSRDKAIKDGFMDCWRKQSSQGGREAEFHRCTISKSVSTGSSCTIQLNHPHTSAAADKYPSATSADRETLSGDFHILNGWRPYKGMPDVSEKFPLRRLALIGHDTSEAERFDI